MSEEKNDESRATASPVDADVKRGVPERIFLQIGEDISGNIEDVEWSEVTWHGEIIFDSDIEYVRARKRRRRPQSP